MQASFLLTLHTHQWTALIHVVLTETQAEGGSSMSNFTWHSSGESHVGSAALQPKGDMHPFCLILLARARLIGKSNFKEREKCDCPEYQNGNWVSVSLLHVLAQQTTHTFTDI